MQIYHLFGSHAYCFDCKFAPAHVKKIFQVGAEKVDNEHVVEAFLPKVVDLGDAGWGRVSEGAGTATMVHTCSAQRPIGTEFVP